MVKGPRLMQRLRDFRRKFLSGPSSAEKKTFKQRITITREQLEQARAARAQAAAERTAAKKTTAKGTPATEPAMREAA